MLDIHELAERELLAFPPSPPQPGRIVAEFDCGTHAVEYAKKHGYTVTPGINHLFAVRELI